MSASQLPTAPAGRTAETAPAAPTAPAGRTADTVPAQPQAFTQRALLLGRYRLGRRLGAGAFGEVRKARDERLDREVAIKLLPRERIVGGRFEREARAAARLSHPGIVTLYEATVDDEGAYLVSELVRGETLHALLAEGRLSDHDIVAIAISLCDALEHAHAHGVIHRDVKPSNILVPERPSSATHLAKLTDFGVARVIGGDSLTRTGDVLGTAAYMAPEQAEGREVTAGADLYALALVIYEALTGINPLRTGRAATRARRLGAYLPPVRRLRRDLPRELGCGIDLALRPRPRERGTVAELRDALVAALPHLDDTPGIVAGYRGALPEQHLATPDAASASEPDAGANGDHEPKAPWRPWRAVAGLAPAPGERTDAPPRASGRSEGSPRQAARIPHWPERLLAAVAAGGLTAWLAAGIVGAHTLPPQAAGLITAALVLLLPRLGWLTATAALVLLAAVSGHTGGALVLVVGLLLPSVLLPRAGTLWPLAAAAPALGLAGLAGAFPALAGLSGRGPWRRASLAALGWMWVVLATPVAGRVLYVHLPAGLPARETWTTSVAVAFHDLLLPLATSGIVLAAVAWGVAAVLLPWLPRGRSLPAEIAAVALWSAGTAIATELTLAAAHHSTGPIAAGAAATGAVGACLVALAPALKRGLARTRDAHGPTPQLP